MTVLTNAVAAGIPGRLAPYRYATLPAAVDTYLKTTAGYEARFDNLSGHSLRRLEIRTGNTDEPRDLVEELHTVLHGPWKWAIDRFDDTVTPADFEAVAHLPWDHPHTIAYRKASSAMDTWHACKTRLYEAWMDWSLDLTGTVEIPDPPGPDPVEVEDGHRVPDCTGHCAQDETCSAELADLGNDTDGHLVAEIYAEPGKPVQAVVFTFDLRNDTTLLRTDDPAKLRAQADRFHEFASRISYGAYILDQLKKREAK
ncbi:hypothetical protein ACFWMH_10440 [Streptomyces tendae]|uniref:hypothetical protein n=1 Tax=Streptomyces tendae TaxID=1932 RepID=UPI00365FA54B